ncbi:dolichol kinase-like isoform X3 [Pomacea canaliculata]|uniref:dolichol kinase-like isoform X3 n=1 Tax=Pomacea canaliculata TaxID=400727 RepID=UPI000D7339E4|nr:dolichol kinase-like isoform X3 [Pomacea canaliculata]
MMILCNRLTGEDWLIIILVTKVLGGLLLQSWNVTHEWTYHCLAGSLVLQVLSIIFFSSPKNGHKGSDTFRTAEQSGIFCILLVPLCFLAEISYTANNCSSCHSRVEEVSFLLACSSIMLMLSSRMLPSLNSVHSSGFIQTAFSLSSGLVLLPVVLTTGETTNFRRGLFFVFTRQERLLLLGWWVLLTVVTAMGVCLYPTLAKKTGTVDKASTAMRKCFHLVVVAVYVPGLVHDPAFLLLASVVALAVLALLETARVTRVKWLGTTIDIAFHVFTDSRDQGPVLLTHIYLLVGLSVPLWLSCNINNKAMLLQLSSGILSLGIGDTIACIAGMRYGLTKWPGTCKSLQGTGFSVTAQLIFITTGLFLGWFESFSWSGVVFAVVASSVYEALTSQIDNLVLPLYTLAALPV